ncbi:MAG: class I SAM-dependent methyltransferase [Ignavibacteria bacterium]|nr:class I SAM-dependent methyltransferase [Ignavibacteria bacterium]
MNSAFDSIAENYDATFTQTKIGKAQREIVWGYLESVLIDKDNLKILELNCGTGEDAVWFSKKGHTVLATDVSDNMLRVTEIKARKNNLNDKIETKAIDLSKINEVNIDEKFDLIFSNFGGINCLTFEELFKLPNSLSRLVKPGGRLIMVIMPTFCWWEMFYFSLKLNLKNAFRRSSTKSVKVKLNGEEILTEYYTPILINKVFGKEFKRVGLKPVGFFIPPSYLKKFFSQKHKTFNFIKKLELFVTNWSLLSNYSDHYLIDFVKK